MQQALSLEAEFSVFRGDLPTVLSGIVPIIGDISQSAGLSRVTSTRGALDTLWSWRVTLPRYRFPEGHLDTLSAPYLL